MSGPGSVVAALSPRDRAIAAIARCLTRAFFRRVEIEGTRPVPGPVILAASHLNGFVDPVVLVARLGRLPRFLAKSTLWDVAVARPLLGFARVIPVYRRIDGGTAEENARTFSAAVAALAGHATVAVFPEGTTHDDPSVRPLRTGVARIALQAAAEGVEGIQIVPVGISYEDKVDVRGRALVSFGAPIDVVPEPGIIGPDGDPDHERVREITDRLQRDLEALTPDFDTTEDALALVDAASLALGGDGTAKGAPPMSRVAATARRLAAVDEPRREALVSLVARYRMLLSFVGLDDEQIVRRIGLTDLARRIAVLGVLVVVLAPLALAGLFANLVPTVLVLLAGLVPTAPVSKGTLRLLVALIAYPVTWALIAGQDATSGWLGDVARRVTAPVNVLLGPLPSDREGWLANIVVFLAVPILGAVALVLLERLRALLVSIVRWRTLLDRRGQLGEVRARRAEVVAMTHDLLGGPP